PPATRRQHTRQAVEEGALGGAVRTDHGADVSAGHGEIDVVEGGEAPEPHGELLGPEEGGGGGARASGGRGAVALAQATRTCRRAAGSSSPWAPPRAAG